MKEQWEREKKKLIGEKAILQDTAHKLNLQVRSVQDEAKRITESGKAAQRAKVSVQAVSPILSASECRPLSHFFAMRATGAGNGQAIDHDIGVRAQNREIQVTVSTRRTRPIRTRARERAC